MYMRDPYAFIEELQAENADLRMTIEELESELTVAQCEYDRLEDDYNALIERTIGSLEDSLL